MTFREASTIARREEGYSEKEIKDAQLFADKSFPQGAAVADKTIPKGMERMVIDLLKSSEWDQATTAAMKRHVSGN